MASFFKEVLFDNFSRSVVKYTYLATGAVGAGGLTGSISPSELTGYLSSVTGQNVNLSVSKILWSAPTATTVGIGLAWGDGTVTGQDFMYLNGSGYVNFVADALPIKNTLTSGGRNNAVQIRNVGSMVTGDAITVLMELEKAAGFSITAAGN